MQTQRWRAVCELIVPSRPGIIWVPAVDYLTIGRLYRIQVLPKDQKEQLWAPDGGPPEGCTADGDPELTRVGVLPMADLAVGALIGRIGGSTADGAGDQDRTFLFSVGRYCVIQAPEMPKVGALYLAVNDTRSNSMLLRGSLKVTVETAF